MTSRLDETKAILGDLIAFPTVSEDSNLDMIAYLKDRLQAAGAKIEIFHDKTGQKANLFATIGPEVDGGIVLSGHCDVVPVTDQNWSTDPFTMEEQDGALYGRGTCDMKGFLAATLAMAPVFADKVRDRPIHYAFTYDEEIGGFGAQDLVESLGVRGIKPGVAIVGEPTLMRIIEGHKGCYEYTTRFTGLAGHASSPDKGVNAVDYAVRFASKLLELKEVLCARAPKDSDFEPPWTTLNAGSLKGGVAHNVIPAYAELQWDMRPVQKSDADLVKQELKDLCENNLLPEMRKVFPEADIVTEIISEVDGFEPADPNEAKDILMALTGANGADLVPFGTEAGIFQDYGMAVAICGPGSIDQAHKADEFVTLDQLQQCLHMLERLGDRLSS